MESKICLSCGKEFVPKKKDVRIRFCCEECRIEYRRKNGYMKDYYRVNNEKWRERHSSEEYKDKKNSARRLRYATDSEFREKHKQSVKEYNERKPEIKLNSRLKKYGLNYDTYLELNRKQNGKCAICGSEIGDAMMNRLYVDHNHKTGKVRGLLCMECNIGLGKFKDNIDLLKNAILYLEVSDGANVDLV